MSAGLLVFIDQVLGGTYTGTIASYNIKFGPPPSVTSGVVGAGARRGEAGNNGGLRQIHLEAGQAGQAGQAGHATFTHLVGGSEHEIDASIY